MSLIRKRPTVVVALCLWVLSSCTAIRVVTHETTFDPGQLESGNYAVDPDHISVVFKVDHLGFANYVGRFNRVNAALDHDPDAPTQSSLAVAIEAGSVDSLNELINAQLKGPAMFDVESHPEITFVSTKIEATGENAGRVTGDLTIRGTTRPATLDVVFNGGGTNPLTQVYTLGFSASGSFLRSEFGLGAWIPAVGDEVSFDIEAEFVRRGDG